MNIPTMCLLLKICGRKHKATVSGAEITQNGWIWLQNITQEQPALFWNVPGERTVVCLSWKLRAYFNEYETINKDVSAGHVPPRFSMNFPQCALKQGTKPLTAPSWEHVHCECSLQNHEVWIRKPQPAPATTHPDCCKYLWALCYNA